MMKILYVEDNPVNLSLIQRIAQMNQHELVSYAEAEVALTALDDGLSIDLILLDIQLAGEMDGIGFAKTIRQRGWEVPIIAITAYAMMGDKERILEAGCNEYLPKPLPIAEFLTLLAKYDPMLKSASDEATPVSTEPPSASEDATPVSTEPPSASSGTPAAAQDDATPSSPSVAKPDADISSASTEVNVSSDLSASQQEEHETQS